MTYRRMPQVRGGHEPSREKTAERDRRRRMNGCGRGGRERGAAGMARHVRSFGRGVPRCACATIIVDAGNAERQEDERPV